ncbi:unnamed protein product [Owenia fusiformis]|uniref:Cytochrome P450 n=1 Tax=Owenia fusiformis TaxID=6347 RepID=A0A8S4NP10_OWEFU|nr:unnamed protein product [Owenia fusiformis]
MDAMLFDVQCIQVWGIHLVVPILLVICIQLLWHHYNLRLADPANKLPLPPGSFGLPLVGESFSFILKANFIRMKRLTLGTVYKTHLLGRPTIRVSGPDNIRKVLMNEHKLVTSHWPKAVQNLLGDGALSMMTSGTSHKNRRRLITKAFTHDALEVYTEDIIAVIREEIYKWCQDKTVKAYPSCHHLTFRLAAEILVGFRFCKEKNDELDFHFHRFVNSFFTLPINLPGFNYRKGVESRNKIHELLDSNIKDRWETDAYSVNTLQVLLDAMKDSGEELDVLGVKEAVVELMFAGYDTVGSALCSVILKLGQNPHVLEKIRDELFVHGILEPSEDVTFAMVGKLPYLNNTVKEVLRTCAPAGGGYRKVLETFELEGYQVPKDWTVIFSIRDTHEHSDTFNKDLTFEPDRWINIEDKSVAHEFIPFGSGPRTCIGRFYAQLVMKLLIIELCRSTEFTLLDKDPVIKILPVFQPKGGLPMEIKKRTVIYQNNNFNAKI